MIRDGSWAAGQPRKNIDRGRRFSISSRSRTGSFGYRVAADASAKNPAFIAGSRHEPPARPVAPPGLSAQLDVLLISFDAVRDRVGPANPLKLG